MEATPANIGGLTLGPAWTYAKQTKAYANVTMQSPSYDKARYDQHGDREIS
jgi:hypothetical protein